MKHLFGFRVPCIAFVVFLMLFCLSSLAFAEEESVKLGTNIDGSTVLEDNLGNPKHDTIIIGASATRTYRYYTREMKDFAVDIFCDNNCLVVITPLPYFDDLTVKGKASDPGIVTGGTSERFKYQDIAAPWTLVEVTNDEASDMTEYDFSARGWQK